MHQCSLNRTSQTVSLTWELPELISRLESNVFQFQGRKDSLLERGSLVKSLFASKLHLRNNAEWKTSEAVLTFKAKSLNSVQYSFTL